MLSPVRLERRIQCEISMEKRQVGSQRVKGLKMPNWWEKSQSVRNRGLSRRKCTLSLCCSVAKVMSDSFVTPWTVLTRILCPWDFPGKNTGVSWHFLLQGISLTQGLNPNLLHWQVNSLPVGYQDRPFPHHGLIFVCVGGAHCAGSSLWYRGSWLGCTAFFSCRLYSI